MYKYIIIKQFVNNFNNDVSGKGVNIKAYNTFTEAA